MIEFALSTAGLFAHAFHAVSPLALFGGGLSAALALGALMLPVGLFTRPLVYAALGVAFVAGVYQLAYASAAHAGDLRQATREAEAERDEARRQLAEREQDLAVAATAAADARESAAANARMALAHQETADAYAQELAARGPNSSCLLGPDDLRALRRLPGPGSLRARPVAPDAPGGEPRRP